MSGTRWVLLPGLDGSGRLFRWFLPNVPDNRAVVVRYPENVAWRIDDYVAHAHAALPQDRPCIVVAESFSGPIALRLLRRSTNVIGLVLVASFVVCPNPILKAAPVSWLVALRGAASSNTLLRAMCLGWRVADERLEPLKAAVGEMSGAVLHARLTLLRELDEADYLRTAGVPILHLAATQDRLVGSDLDPLRNCACLQTASIDGPHFLLQARPTECWQVIAAWQRCLRQ